MILFGLSQLASQALCIFILLVIFVGVPWFVFSGGPQKFCQKTLFRRYDGLALNEAPSKGDVQFVYHTYRGFLLWFVQDEHAISAPPDDAKILLGRLLRFNLTYGLLSYGLVFIPIIAVGNYLAQMRSIQKQLVESGEPPRNDG